MGKGRILYGVRPQAVCAAARLLRSGRPIVRAAMGFHEVRLERGRRVEGRAWYGNVIWAVGLRRVPHVPDLARIMLKIGLITKNQMFALMP